MGQEFQAVACFSCGAFQSQAVKKSGNRFACRLCGERQSVRKVYAIGKGADVRGVVASLNATRLSGDVEAEGGARAGQARPAAAALPAAGGEAPAPSAATRCAPPATDWSAFMDAEEAGAPPSSRPALGEDEDEEDAQYVTCLPERRAKRSKPSPAEVGCRAGRENRQPRWQTGEQPGRERYDAPCRQRPGPSATDRPMAAQPFMQALRGGNPSTRAAPAPDRMPQNGGPREEARPRGPAALAWRGSQAGAAPQPAPNYGNSMPHTQAEAPHSFPGYSLPPAPAPRSLTAPVATAGKWAEFIDADEPTDVSPAGAQSWAATGGVGALSRWAPARTAHLSGDDHDNLLTTCLD
eukprot:jgi/Tetstr1/437189/TSEL_002760.t1